MVDGDRVPSACSLNRRTIRFLGWDVSRTDWCRKAASSVPRKRRSPAARLMPEGMGFRADGCLGLGHEGASNALQGRFPARYGAERVVGAPPCRSRPGRGLSVRSMIAPAESLLADGTSASSIGTAHDPKFSRGKASVRPAVNRTRGNPESRETPAIPGVRCRAQDCTPPNRLLESAHKLEERVGYAQTRDRQCPLVGLGPRGNAPRRCR
jgi:hypothetical protein